MRRLLGCSSLVFAIGGYAAPGWDVVEYLDTTTNEWTTGPSLPTPRYGLAGVCWLWVSSVSAHSAHGVLFASHCHYLVFGTAAVALGDNIYAIGGVAWHVAASNVVEVLNTKTMTWSTGAPMTTNRAYVVRQPCHALHAWLYARYTLSHCRICGPCHGRP